MRAAKGTNHVINAPVLSTPNLDGGGGMEGAGD
jgi:hypothetical protein